MKTTIEKGKLNGIIDAVPSKSYFHRYIIASMLASGKSKIMAPTSNLSNDIKASLSCVSALGGKYQVFDKYIEVEGIEKNNSVPILDCLESGSTLRFLIPVSLCFYDKVIMKGTPKLISRGIGVYDNVFELNNIKANVGYDAVTLNGKLKSGEYNIDGSISSQFISGLLFALPILDGDSKITITKPINSSPYIDITIDVLKEFGIIIDRNDNIINIKGNQKYKSSTFNVEGDYSNAAFLDAFNYFGSNVSITNLKENSLQGDKVYKEYFDILSKGNCTLDISNAIDLGPILFVFASLQFGATFIGTERLKIKESNRLDDMLYELSKIGVKYQVLEDGHKVIIEEAKIDEYKDIEFDSHNDHRLSMSLSLIASIIGGSINDSEAVKKSYPNFFDDLKSLGLTVL